MEESQCLMWMKRKQVLKSHIFGASCNNNKYSWEERAFEEDATRILGGCIWPPRSYSCNFCKREFRSAQALGGHMNVHRRDRARLKQSLGHHNEALNCHHKNDFTTSRLSTISTQENCFQPTMSPYSSSSISWGHQHHMESPDSEAKGLVNARDQQFFKGSACNESNDYVETSLSVGQNSVFGQNLPTDSCGDEVITCKRPKTNSISSLPVFHKPCSNDRRLTLQSAEFVLGLKPGMEDLDLELRLGKTQKV